MSDQLMCTYCGAAAEHDDHLLPRPWTGDERRKRVETVPACRECNLLLSDKLIPDLADRRWFLLHAVRRRHAPLLKGRSWSDEEIAAVGHDLAHKLRRREYARRSVLARLEVLGSTEPPVAQTPERKAPRHPAPPPFWLKGFCAVCGKPQPVLSRKYCPGACKYAGEKAIKDAAKARRQAYREEEPCR